MNPAMRRLGRLKPSLGPALCVCVAGCGTVAPGPGSGEGSAPPQALSPASKEAASSLQPGQTLAADVLQRWGQPFTQTVFDQGHQVWQYYQPRHGISLQSYLPGADMLTTERGREATEVLLVFDRKLVLRQVLVRELPGNQSGR